jgi:lipopolysaccharide export system ATP-binding protein
VPLLQAQALQKAFAGRTVVNGVSFHVGRAEIVGLLGRNGAGKTTSFRMTIGMIEPDAGKTFFDNEDVSSLPMYQRARLGMGYLSQEPSVFTRMTCEQNLLAILETLPMSRQDRRDRAAELLEQFHLAHKAKHQARTCSGGERRKLEIARALVIEPKLILLDEPFSGVDPIAVEDLQKEIHALAARGIACLVTDHNVQQTLRVCDRAYIIDEGKVFAEGTPRDLINNEMVRRVYLGSLFRGDEFDDLPLSGSAVYSSQPHAAQPYANPPRSQSSSLTPMTPPAPTTPARPAFVNSGTHAGTNGHSHPHPAAHPTNNPAPAPRTAAPARSAPPIAVNTVNTGTGTPGAPPTPAGSNGLAGLSPPRPVMNPGPHPGNQAPSSGTNPNGGNTNSSPPRA